MDTLFEQSQMLIKRVETKFHRNLNSLIDWDCRLIEINGARGVGKTTLMLQRAKLLANSEPEKTLYISLDDPYFYKNSVIDTASYFVKWGGKFLFIDEVHKYPSKFPGKDWSSELKIIYDRYPELFVVFSGSSILQLFKGDGDLSRRKCRYKLHGLSFREYLNWQHKTNFEVLSLTQILNNHSKLSSEISEKVKILPLFNEYLKHGYYPYYFEAPKHFCSRLKETVNVILEQDIPVLSKFSYETNIKLKKLLAILSESAPFTPNLTKLRSELFIADQRTLLNYINILEKAELLYTLDKESHGMKRIQKPSKIYLNNTNLSYCLFQDNPNKGTIRETFFLNQLKAKYRISYPEFGDFLVNSKYLFEIGGKSKNYRQIKDINDAYLVIDDVEISYANKIPLWLFGFIS
jgi:predicted AAA+ superfamily ATPase